MVTYLSGKISGPLKYYNLLNAFWWARKLSKEGHNVLVPHHNFYYGLDYETYMKNDLEIVAKCDAIAMLPNWTTSKGAIRELEKAKELNKIIIYL